MKLTKYEDEVFNEEDIDDIISDDDDADEDINEVKLKWL